MSVCIDKAVLADYTLIDRQCFNDIQIETNFNVRDASVDEIKQLDFNCLRGVNNVPDGAKIIVLEHENECILAYMVLTIKENKTVTTVNVHELCATANNFNSASQFMMIAFARTFTQTQVVFKFNVDIDEEGLLHGRLNKFFRDQDGTAEKKNFSDTRRDAYYHAGKEKFTHMVKTNLHEDDFVQQLIEIGFKVAVVRRRKEEKKSKYLMVLELTSKCENGQMRELKKSKRKLETIQPVPLTPHTARRLTTSKFLPGPTEYDFIYADLEDSQRPYDETLPELGPLEELDEELDEYFTRENFEPFVNSGSDDDYQSDDDYY